MNERERELSLIRPFVVTSIPPGADATNDYWRARVARLESGPDDEAEFAQWYGGEIFPLLRSVVSEPILLELVRKAAAAAFAQGLAVGREGRA